MALTLAAYKTLLEDLHRKPDGNGYERSGIYAGLEHVVELLLAFPGEPPGNPEAGKLREAMSAYASGIQAAWRETPSAILAYDRILGLAGPDSSLRQVPEIMHNPRRWLSGAQWEEFQVQYANIFAPGFERYAMGRERERSHFRVSFETLLASAVAGEKAVERVLAVHRANNRLIRKLPLLRNHVQYVTMPDDDYFVAAAALELIGLRESPSKVAKALADLAHGYVAESGPDAGRHILEEAYEGFVVRRQRIRSGQTDETAFPGLTALDSSGLTIRRYLKAVPESDRITIIDLGRAEFALESLVEAFDGLADRMVAFNEGLPPTATLENYIVARVAPLKSRQRKASVELPPESVRRERAPAEGHPGPALVPERGQAGVEAPAAAGSEPQAPAASRATRAYEALKAGGRAAGRNIHRGYGRARKVQMPNPFPALGHVIGEAYGRARQVHVPNPFPAIGAASHRTYERARTVNLPNPLGRLHRRLQRLEPVPPLPIPKVPHRPQGAPNPPAPRRPSMDAPTLEDVLFEFRRPPPAEYHGRAPSRARKQGRTVMPEPALVPEQVAFIEPPSYIERFVEPAREPGEASLLAMNWAEGPGAQAASQEWHYMVAELERQRQQMIEPVRGN